MTNPTARSKRRLEAEGYRVASVEKWIPQVRRRIDLFGFADLVAIRTASIVAIQSTSASNLAARTMASFADRPSDDVLARLKISQ